MRLSRSENDLHVSLRGLHFVYIVTHLVVDVRDVHDEVDIVAEVVSQDAADDVLREIVSIVSSARKRRLEKLTEHAPYATSRTRSVRSCTNPPAFLSSGQTPPAHQLELACSCMRLTLLLVSELYTFKTGSSTRFVGLTHSGMADEDALGASAAADMVNGLQAMRYRAVACGLRAGDGKL